MPTGFRIDPEKCTECERCAAACSFAKQGQVRPSVSRITVLRRWPETPEIRICRFDECPGQPCVASCPVEAIAIRGAPAGGGRSLVRNLVLIDRELCAGCGACVDACPFQAIRLEPAHGTGGEQRAFKCDYCGGDPACVSECVTGALAVLEDAPAALGRGEA